MGRSTSLRNNHMNSVFTAGNSSLFSFKVQETDRSRHCKGMFLLCYTVFSCNLQTWLKILTDEKKKCEYSRLSTYPDFLSRLSLALLFFQTHDLSRNSCIWNSRKWSYVVLNEPYAPKVVYFIFLQGRKIFKEQLWPDRLSDQFAKWLGFDRT